MNTITYIDEVTITNKRVLLRVDYNVSLNPDHTIANDLRITQSLPTIQHLAASNNTLIIISHLGDPKGKDPTLSLRPVVDRLQKYLPSHKVVLIENFLQPITYNPQTIYVLENIRYYPEETTNDKEFAKKLATLGEVYVNDAFGVCHRTNTSIVTLPTLLPSYGGLLLKKEVQAIEKAFSHPQKPFVAIIGGAKIATKIHLIDKLLIQAEYVLIGGALANTFFVAQGINVGNSLYEPEKVIHAKTLQHHALSNHTHLIAPHDVILASGENVSLHEIPIDGVIVDIGKDTQQQYKNIISSARTIIWNGPMGKFEDPKGGEGTNIIYHAVVENEKATSIVGGGETITALAHEDDTNKITHISTGGGAMLEFIEKETLPGLEVLKKTT